MTVDQATHAAQCCPSSALRQLSPADLAALAAWCARAMADPDAEPWDGDEAAAVACYEALLAERARDWRKEPPLPRRPRALERGAVVCDRAPMWGARDGTGTRARSRL